MVFPFGKTMSPTLTPVLSPPHAAPRPPRRLLAQRRGDLISHTLFLVVAAWPNIEAAAHPEEGPISHPQDRHFDPIMNDDFMHFTRGVPPGGGGRWDDGWRGELNVAYSSIPN